LLQLHLLQEIIQAFFKPHTPCTTLKTFLPRKITTLSW
jgi:hypothetical protein